MIAAAAGRSRQESVAASLIVFACMAALCGAVVSGHGLRVVGPATVFVVVLTVFHKVLLSWRSLLGLTLLTILFIPIRRYSLPANLPLNLEPYRIIVGIVIVLWLLSLLVDPRVALRASRFEAPLLCYLAVIVLSLLVNRARFGFTATYTTKNLTFLLSYIVLFYVVVSVVRRATDIDFMVRLLVGGGAVLGIFALVESATHVNIFNHLSSVFPVLAYNPGLGEETLRGGGLRVTGSAQHPIAFGAAFAMLVPLAVYRARCYGQWRWWAVLALLVTGVFATRSRTGAVMLIAIAIVFLALRPMQTKRFWPALVPLVIVIHFAVPGALGTLQQSFFPKDTTLLAQEHKNAVGSGRIATLGPVLRHEFLPNPLLGEGAFTRVTVAQPNLVTNAPITDDMWLGILAETGIAGALALGWVFARSVRRMGRAAKRDQSPRGWLLVAAAASVTAYAVGMFTYDSFAFIQVTFLLFIILAVGATALLSKPEEWGELFVSD